MDLIKTVSDLAEVLNRENLSIISIKLEDFEIRIASANSDYRHFKTAPLNRTEPVPETVRDGGAKAGNYIKSPIIGTFYASPSPEKPPFVKVGDSVKKGQVVCIVESMKVMNEITSEFDGKVAEILFKDGETVDFDKEIMRLET